MDVDGFGKMGLVAVVDAVGGFPNAGTKPVVGRRDGRF